MSSESVKFTLKKTDTKFVKRLNSEADKIHPEYISSVSDLNPFKQKKQKNLVIPSTGNLWQPGGISKNQNIDDITKEAINQILDNPKSEPLNDKAIFQSKNMNSKSSLQFPGVKPQIESTLEDYTDVPVSDFGKALMRGMGWEEGKGVGRKRKLVHPINFDTQKRTLGVTIHEETIAEAERLSHEFHLGDYVEIISGQNKGDHAKILSITVETCRCILRLPSDEIVDVVITAIQSGCRQEYLKQRDAASQLDEDIFSGKKSELKYKAKSKKNIKIPLEQNLKMHKKAWLHQDLKVRIICQKFKKGKYYCKKVDIVDIVDPFICTCRTEDGKLLENVPQSIIETVIPKTKGSLVMLLSKSNRFEVAELEEKDSKLGNVICVTLLEKDVVTASFDEVCQYVGDVVR